MKKNTQEQKLKLIKLSTVLSLFVFVFIATLLFNVITYKEDIATSLSKILFWCEIGFLEGISLILVIKFINSSHEVIKEANELEDTSWMEEKDLKKIKSFKVFNFKNVKKMGDGIVIGAEKKKGGLNVIETDDLHALIVGTTGAGKTTGFVDQNISILSRTKDKPSLVITDPKCELYEKHANTLEDNGYDIQVLNLRDPYFSTKWNPFEILLEREDKIKARKKDVVKNKDGKYVTEDGKVYDSLQAMRNECQIFKDEVYENAKDLVFTLCPIKNKDQPNWEAGARNLILGFVLALLEDYENGKINRESVTLLNVYHNIFRYTSGKIDKLKKYLVDSRDDLSNIKSLASGVLITKDNTLKCYLSDVQQYLQDFADEGLLALTSENEMTLGDIDDKPTALFIIIPDEKKTRHKFATLFVTQLYKQLCDKANKNYLNIATPTARLKRNTYFILDEFGNLPEFESIESMVTVARSRGIKFLFVLQSYAQLTARYPTNIAEIIKTNCNVKIFIGTDDQKTRSEFSELCGKRKARRVSVSSHQGEVSSSNESVASEPLITPSELERLNGRIKGQAVVSIRGYEPLKTKFTPSFALNNLYFYKGSTKLGLKEVKEFNKRKLYCDIAEDGIKEESIVEEEIEKKIMNSRGWAKPEEFKEDKIAELDTRFQDIINLIKKGIDRLGKFLTNKDRIAISKVETKDLIQHLRELKPKYKDEEVIDKIDKMIYFIEEKVRDLRIIREEADKIRNYEK